MTRRMFKTQQSIYYHLCLSDLCNLLSIIRRLRAAKCCVSRFRPQVSTPTSDVWSIRTTVTINRSILQSLINCFLRINQLRWTNSSHLLFVSRIRPFGLFRFEMNFCNYGHYKDFWKDSLCGGSAKHKVSTYRVQHNTEKTRANIHTSSEIRTHDLSVRVVQTIRDLNGAATATGSKSTYIA
jgi:hypothetical protein